MSIVGQNGPNEVDMEALTAKPFITDENNASPLVILLFFAHSATIIYTKIATSRRHLLVGKRTILAYLETLAKLIFVLGIKLFCLSNRKLKFSAPI